jgi:integrase
MLALPRFEPAGGEMVAQHGKGLGLLILLFALVRRARWLIHPQRLTTWFTRHRKAAGIDTGSLHILRHTPATLALTSGVPVHIVAARLGDTPTTVLSTYAHLLPQSDEIAAERVAAALSP